MRVLVVLSGSPPPPALVSDVGADLVIAADGGGNVLHAMGLTPHVLVGDMDSIAPEALAAFERAGVDLVRHPGAKRDTDGALAVDEALERGAREVVIVGSTGGRLDHALANVHLVRRAADAGARVRLVEEDGTLWSVTPGAPLAFDLQPGTTVSVLPLTDEVAGVTLTGFRWNLTDAVMRAGDPYGVSNETAAGAQRVACATGVLAVVAPRKT